MDIDVVVPAYNAERTLRAALDSVRAQTAPAHEILVIDDGSKDGTREIASAYASNGAPRVRLLTQANGGPSRARNWGVRESRAEFIAFLDADDAWEPTKLERQLEAFARKPEAVLCYTGLQNVTPTGERLEYVPPAPEGVLSTRLRLGNPQIVPSCVMVRREAFEKAGGFLLTLKGSEDWEFWVRLHQQGPFCAVDEPLTLYTVSNTGLSSNADHMYREACILAEQHLLHDLDGLPRMLWRRRILSYQSYKAALTARAAFEHGKELRYILQSFGYWPNPLWEPHRARVLAVSLRNGLIRRGIAPRTAKV